MAGVWLERMDHSLRAAAAIARRKARVNDGQATKVGFPTVTPQPLKSAGRSRATPDTCLGEPTQEGQRTGGRLLLSTLMGVGFMRSSDAARASELIQSR